MAATAFALRRTNFAHRLQLALEARDPFLHTATINFQLRFTRAARADSTSLPRKVRPHSGQTREQILQLRELDLQAPFATARALREDVEDELRAIEHLAIEHLLEVAPLCGREFVVEDHR